MERRSLHRPRTHTPTVLAVAVTAILAVGCSARADPDQLNAELARLRREHQAIKKELLLLRAETRRRPAARATETPAAQPPTPADAHPGLAIAALLDAYREALESEDLQYMRDEIYGGDLPVEDSRYLEVWFDRTEELEVQLEPVTVNFEDGRAQAVILKTMTYRLTRTHEKRTLRLELQMLFEREAGTWRLSRALVHR